MEYLFSSFTLKGLKFKNRIVMPSLASFLIEEDGRITDRTVEHYRRRAAGGPSMITMEACAVSPEGIVSPHQARIHDDSLIDGLRRIADAIKEEGAIAAIQIHHGGRQTSYKVIGRRPLAPSPLPCPTIRGEVEPLSISQIKRLVKSFGDAAERAVSAGYQLIEIHGAHGYLINQFLSRFSNIRDDEYGGDIEGRSRFAVEIIKEVRKRVGKDFPLSFKISAQEFVPNGLTVEESIEILKILIKEGIDIVSVSAGNDATPEWICQPMFMKPACLTDSAKKIKDSLGIPVMAVGRINDPFIADSIIKEGKSDLVCIGRGLLADPEMPKKAKEGRFEDIRTCIACNTCMESIFRRGRVECLVNPTLGREKEMAIRPAKKPKKIMVVGGGPGGLNVSWVAAKRGHKVLLFEKGSYLGGQLLLGSITFYKKGLMKLVEFLINQVKKTGVEYHLNYEVTINTVKEIGPDAVVLATGSIPIRPQIKGLDDKMVSDIRDILNGDIPAKKRTIIVGGGATGCELALHLSDYGSEVILVEKMANIGAQIESITRKMILRKLKENNVTILTESHVSRANSEGVFIIDRDGVERFYPVERIVFAVGNRSYNELYNEIKALKIPVFQIGDCLEPRSAKTAIYEAAIIGRTI